MKTFEEEFLSESFYQNPYPIYEKLHNLDSIVYMDSIKSWVVTRYDDVISWLNNSNLSADRWNSYFGLLTEEEQKVLFPLKDFFAKWLLFSDWEYHKNLRSKLVKSSFFKSLEKDRIELTEYAWTLMDEIINYWEEVDLFKDYSMPLSIKAISKILWLEPEEFKKVMDWTNKMITFIWSWKPNLEQGKLALSAYYEFVNYVNKKIESDNNLNYWDNLTNDLLKLYQDWEILLDELIATLWNIIIDWYEPSALSISHGINLLWNDQKSRKLAIENPTLLQTNWLQEIFRLEPPFMCTARRALDNIEFWNVSLNINDRVLFVLWSANRDKSIFENPNKMDLNRTNANKQLTFWSWKHKCIWLGLASSTVNIWLKTFLEKTEWKEINIKQPIYKESVGLRWFNKLIWKIT